MQNKKVVIFDLDGTIADSEEVLFEVVNELSSKFGFRKIKKEEIPDLKNKTIKELMKEFKISYLKLPLIVGSARKMFRSRISEVQPVEGIEEALKELKNRGYRIVVVTTNNARTAQDFLKNREISAVDEVIGGGSLFGKAKTLQKVMKKEGISSGEAFYVGDEVRDVEAAKKAGLGTVSVAWGFNSPDALKRHDPDHLITRPEDLLDILD
jgi:phosphoglycolate phosphatase-like HAD superfamily hydrolase